MGKKITGGLCGKDHTSKNNVQMRQIMIAVNLNYSFVCFGLVCFWHRVLESGFVFFYTGFDIITMLMGVPTYDIISMCLFPSRYKHTPGSISGAPPPTLWEITI